MAEFGLEELAKRAGVTPRTVRYYVAQGLLPRPGRAWQRGIYTDEHLLRLQAIQRLKEAYLPLDEIRRRLEQAGPRELEIMAQGPPPRLQTGVEVVDAPPSSPRYARREAAEGAVGAGEVWHRVALGPGVELHYQPSAGGRLEALVAELAKHTARRLREPGRGE